MRNWLVCWGRPAAFGAIALVLAACGSANEEYARFASAGVTFSDSLPSAYAYAFDRQVEKRLGGLEIERTRRIEAKRALDQTIDDRLTKAIEGFDQRQTLLRTAEEHAIALRLYFATLAAMASGAESQAIGDKAAGLADKIARLSDKVASSLVTGAIRQFATLAVAAYRNAQLRKHMETYYPTIGRAIILQKELLIILRQNEIADWEGDEQARVDAIRQDVREAFMNSQRQLPSDWKQRLLAKPRTIMPESPLSQGIAAADQLEQNFIRIVEGKPGALEQLEQSVQILEKISESIQFLQK